MQTKPGEGMPSRRERIRGARHGKRRGKAAFWRYMAVLFIIVMGALGVATDALHSFRYTLAEDLYTSQHRYLAKYLVSAQDLARIAYVFAHPNVVNEFPDGSVISYDSGATSGGTGAAVTVRSWREGEFDAYEIGISHPSWVKLVWTADGPGGRGLTLQEAMEKYHALAGINAGGFDDPGGDGNGGTPGGLLIIDGKLVNPASYLVGTNEVMGMTRTGQWFMGDYSASFLLAHQVQYAIQFGPELIAQGKVLVSGTAGWGFAPRTVIGQKANGDVVFWVNDGRWGNGLWDLGASLGQVAEILQSQGVVDAFNLDGGGVCHDDGGQPGRQAAID